MQRQLPCIGRRKRRKRRRALVAIVLRMGENPSSFPQRSRTRLFIADPFLSPDRRRKSKHKRSSGISVHERQRRITTTAAHIRSIRETETPMEHESTEAPKTGGPSPTVRCYSRRSSDVISLVSYFLRGCLLVVLEINFLETFQMANIQADP